MNSVSLCGRQALAQILSLLERHHREVHGVPGGFALLNNQLYRFFHVEHTTIHIRGLYGVDEQGTHYQGLHT